MASYATTAAMAQAIATAIADYYTKAQIDTTLEDYATIADVAATLADYYTKYFSLYPPAVCFHFYLDVL